MSKKLYRVEWVDMVSRSVTIYAESEEDVLSKFDNEEGYEWSEVCEDGVEYHQEPYVGGIIDD